MSDSNRSFEHEVIESLATLRVEVQACKEGLREVNETFKDYVRVERFALIERIVYGGAALVGTIVATAVLSGVVLG